MSLYNFTNVIKEVKIGTSGYSEAYVGDTKVFPPPVVGNKLTVINVTGHSGYSIDCNASSTLTQEECRLYDMDYRTFTDASIGTCVESIGAGAFALYYALSAITIPSSVISIGQTAFHICSGLTSVVIPDSVTSIGNGCFEYCFSLESINIPSGVTSLEDYTFVSCSGLTSITIPDSVTSIGNSCFQGCSGLSEIRMESTTPPTLAGSVFDNTNDCQIIVPCNSLSAYSAAPTWSAYTNRLVEDCDAGYKARLMYDNDLSKVYDIPLDGMGDNELIDSDLAGSPYDYSALTYVLVGDIIEVIDSGVFINAPSLTAVSFGSGLQRIRDMAFSGCTNLTNVSFDNVNSQTLRIDRSAFQGCALGWTLTLPSSTTIIGDFAFYQTTNLHDVRIYATTPPSIGSWVFSRRGAGGANILPDNVYVPHGYLQTYQDDASWSQYNLVEMSD